MATAKDVTQGGAFLNAGPGLIWTGLADFVNSLMVIRTLVFETSRFTLQQIVDALDHNFVDYEALLTACLRVPKYGNDIADLMSNDLAASLENMMAGAPPSNDPLAESMSRIHDLFVAFLDNQEMDGMPGVPTRRALLGISKRLKEKRGEPRASFIDTGTYQAAMRAWVSGVLNAFPE